MRKILLAGVLVSAFVAGEAFAAAPANAEFAGWCAQNLVNGKQVATDCSINWTDEKTHKLYCFASNGLKTEWAKNTEENVKKALEHYTNLSKGTTGTEHKG